MAQRAPFPNDPDAFGEDERISYSKENKTFLLEDELGQEWEWLSGPRKWSQTMDEALVKQQAEIYKVAGVDENEPALNPAQKRKNAQLEQENAKRARANQRDGNTNANSDATADGHATATATAAADEKPRRANTAVFVTGLPLDVDQDEVRTYFGKFGIIAESVDDGEKRVKLYNDKDGNFKGEALIIYIHQLSVPNAVMLADGDLFPRLYDDAESTRITVQEADDNYKAHKDDTVANETPQDKKARAIYRAKAKKKAEEMARRLADWGDDEEPSAMQQTSARYDKTVVIKNAFTLKQLEDDPDLLRDVHLDMEEGAMNHGQVKNLTVFDLEDDGIVTVRFSNSEGARAFAEATDRRAYNGKRLETYVSDGKERFKKSGKRIVLDDEDEQTRLEQYRKFIEGDDE